MDLIKKVNKNSIYYLSNSISGDTIYCHFCKMYVTFDSNYHCIHCGTDLSYKLKP